MTHDMGSAHPEPTGRPQRRNAVRPTGQGSRPRGLVQKARTKRTRILTGHRHIKAPRWTGELDPAFEVGVSGVEGLADVRYLVVRTRSDYIVTRTATVPPFGAPSETRKVIPRSLVEWVMRYRRLGSITDYELGYTAIVMFVALDHYIPTPSWVSSVRVHLRGRPFPRPDDDNAPDYYREGDGESLTLEGAIADAFEQADCDRFGEDNYP